MPPFFFSAPSGRGSAGSDEGRVRRRHPLKAYRPGRAGHARLLQRDTLANAGGAPRGEAFFTKSATRQGLLTGRSRIPRARRRQWHARSQGCCPCRQQGGEAVCRVLVKAAHEGRGQQLRRVGHVLGHADVLGGQLKRGQCAAGGRTRVRCVGRRVVCCAARAFFSTRSISGARAQTSASSFWYCSAKRARNSSLSGSMA